MAEGHVLLLWKMVTVLYYELESNNFGKNEVSRDKSKKISTKKEDLEKTNANWVPLYSDLSAEGNYHP